MGTADHDAALADAQAKFDALTDEILDDPGLNDSEKDAVLALADKVQDQITDATEKLEKGLKVANLARDLFKDPLGMLGRVGPLLGL